MTRSIRLARRAVLASALLASFASAALAGDRFAPMPGETPAGLLSTLRGNAFIASSVPLTGPGVGDENPYSVVLAPLSAGKIKEGDVLFDNFNNAKNYQGTGTTIMQYDPKTQHLSVFARFDPKQVQCPGGVGLTAAMAVLRSGYVIVGSMPSVNGEASTLGQGCLLVADAQGRWVKTLTAPQINGPWGNMAVVDEGDHATLFISNIGFGLKGASNKTVKRLSTVVRMDLRMDGGKPPVVKNLTVVGKGYPARASVSAFAKGPTGMALSADGTLYVSNALDNGINVIPDALTRSAPPKENGGMGSVLTHGGALKSPLAVVMTPQDKLIVSNALNGQLVEIDARSGRQLGTYWADDDPAQQPPGSGDLFGLALSPDGKGLYFVRDDNNTLMEAVPQ